MLNMNHTKLFLLISFVLLAAIACNDAKINVKFKNAKSTPASPTMQTGVGAAVLINGSYQLKAEVKQSSQVVLTNGPYTLQAEVVR